MHYDNIGFRLAPTIGFSCLLPLGYLVIQHQSSAAFQLALACWIGAIAGIIFSWRTP